MTFKGNIRKKSSHNTDEGIKDFEDYDYDQQPKNKWYDELNEDPKNFSTSTEQVFIDLKDEAKKCHDSEVANYNIRNAKTNSNFQWIKTVLAKGTVSDKVAAHTVSILDNPCCSLETIRNLVGMVKAGKKKECIAVIDALTELFISDLLRPNKRLKAFHQRPLALLNELSSGNAVTRRKLLSLWYFEDQLKEIYTSYVLALNNIAHDTVDSNKEKAINAMYKLLAGNPEQEQNLLNHIINKLGDPSQKVASKVIYCLTQLLRKHINMQGVVLTEIEKLLFRPNISSRAQYYSLCFLSQYHLSHESSDIAQKLIQVYFSFFKSCVKTGDIDSRMMSALLMGINRAYPFAKIKYEKIAEHIDTMYRIVHLANFNVGLHALTLLYQVADFGNAVANRFYGALYRKLLDPNVLTTSHRAMFLSLIYKALLKDTQSNRLKVFIKRLLQISLYAQPCFACGILYLISQLMKKKNNLQSLTMKSLSAEGKEVESNISNEEITIKEEPEDPLYLRSDQPTLNIKVETIDIVKQEIEEPQDPSNVVVKQEKLMTKYNPVARNPLYSGGEFCIYTELHNLSNHFHPTVSLFATNIINGETIKYSGDPLNDFTLIRFLDRFVFKNPKQVKEKTGVDQTFGKRKLLKPKGIKLMPVNSSGYLKENSGNIPVDELFLHSFLQQRYVGQQRKSEYDDSDLESIQSEEFEELLDKMASVQDTEDIDYMEEIGDSMKIKDKKRKNAEHDVQFNENDGEYDDDGDIDDNDEFDDNDDFVNDGDDMDDSDKDLLEGVSDDEEDIEFLDEETPKQNKKGKFKTKGNVSSIFASADEFATLLEEEGSSKKKPGGSNAILNADNANVKQLAWEEKRNWWLNGFDRAVKDKKGKAFSSKKQNFTKKRPNKSKDGNKSKKKRN